MCGVDVNHGGSKKTRNSIMAFVSSLNPECTKYALVVLLFLVAVFGVLLGLLRCVLVYGVCCFFGIVVLCCVVLC